MKTTHILAALTVAVAGTALAGTPTTVQHPLWAPSAVIYEVNTRQFSPEGTFAAVEQNLDRLKDLGVDILWFMPIHPISEKNRKGSLGSYYAVKDYKGVNPEFGTLEDFKHLVSQAHARGMKVIIDWVPNHTGCDNAWTTEHPEYYARNDKGEMYGPFDWTDTYKLDYSNPATRTAMTDAMKFWLTEADIDGFRCDVAMQVPTDYWNTARKELQDTKADIFMLAEASVPELEEHAFDMAYNWPMKDLYSAIAATSGQYTFAPEGGQPRTFPTAKASDIFTLYQQQQADYPAGAMMMNMVTNHDLNSWEGTEFERLGNLTPAFAVVSYILPGMPLMYTGQEVGMDRAFKFFEKDEAPDFTPNRWTELYRMLNGLKHTRPELTADGNKAQLIPYRTTSADVLVLERRAGDSRTIAGVNLGKMPAPVVFNGLQPDVAGAVNRVDPEKPAQLPESLMPGEFFIFTVN